MHNATGDDGGATIIEATSDALKLTPAQQVQLDALDGRPNTDDAPEAPAESWERAHLFRSRKQAISLRLDADVLDWLRRGGDGWQTRINRILRERMDADRA